MDLKRKKIIAKEVLILSSVIAIVFIFYGVLMIVENKRETKLQDLTNEQVKINLKIDSVKLNISYQIPDSYSDANPFNVQLPPLPKGFKLIWDSGKVKILYEATVKDFNLGTFDEFLKNMYNDSTRMVFYKIASTKFDLGDYNTFSNKVTTDIRQIVLKNKILDSLNNKFEVNKKAIKSNTYFNYDKILRNLLLVLLFIVYPLRGLILLVNWSIKTVKE
jgi:hypothetical protein